MNNTEYEQGFPIEQLQNATQPMGPLEQGDQALVDAVQDIPNGDVTGRLDNVWVRVSKCGRDVVTERQGPDGSIEQTAVTVLSYPQPGRVDARIEYWPDGGRSNHRETNIAIGNEVGEFLLYTCVDRKEAQKIKFLAAQNIKGATEHMKKIITG